MATMKVRVCVRCSDDSQSEIAQAAIWEIEYLLEKHMECLMRQLSGGYVIVDQIIVERDPFDSIGDNDLQRKCS